MQVINDYEVVSHNMKIRIIEDFDSFLQCL